MKAQQLAADAADRSASATEWQKIPTLVQIGFAALGTLGLIASLILNAFAISKAQNAIDVTERIGRDHTRAYLYVSRVEFAQDSDGNFQILAWVKNGGDTPAKAFGLASRVKILHQFSGEVAPLGEHDHLPWGAIGSHDELSVEIQQDDLEKIIAEFNRIGRHASLMIFGNVKYQTIYNEVCVTDFVFITKEKLVREGKVDLTRPIGGGMRSFKIVGHESG